MLSVIVPTRNEEANIEPLVERVSHALEGTDWELLFVDDSDDGTPEAVTAVGMDQVRLLHRPLPERRGGLAGAVCAGFEAARGDYLAVMDGDLQHDPGRLRDLRAALDHAEVAIASRFTAGGGGLAGLDGGGREAVSQATRVAVRGLFPRIRRVRDPMAGFFAIRRSVLERAALRPDGFKVLLEVLVRGSWRDVIEIPFAMAPRAQGVSKATLREGFRFGRHVLRLRFAA